MAEQITDRLARCEEKYARVVEKLLRSGETVTAMESCTSGTIASLLTDTEGASAVFRGAFIAYSNQAKVQFGVPEDCLKAFGVYSREVACAMAEACRKTMKADVGIGVTGSLGREDPANPDSVSGQVFFAVSREGETVSCFLENVTGDTRYACKLAVAEAIADVLLKD